MRPELLERQLPLTEEEKKELKARYIKKHDYTTIWFHWFNATMWLLLLPTGAALINSEKYHFVPLGFTQWVSSFFKGREHLLQFHIWTGILWTLILLYAVFGFKRYSSVVKSMFLIDADDLEWFKVFTARMFGRSGTKPAQGFFNAGQKIVAVNVYIMTPLIMLSGLVMAFQLLPPGYIRWAIVIHFITVGAVFLGLPVHIFMAALYAPEHEAFTSMLTGYLNEYFAYRHNYKFWREAKKSELREMSEKTKSP